MVFARESSKSDKIDAKDRISELPEPIKRHILFFMCPEDAARTTVLSKTWQQTWNSLRRLSFESVGLDCTKTLEIPHTEKVIIQKFKVLVLQEGAALISCIDEWLELVLGNYINELHLYILFFEYTLPKQMFAAKSLAILNLMGCRLVESFFDENAKFTRLKELTLENVVQDGNAIQELLNRCPMLDAFSIDKCLNVYCLKLFILPNLKMAKINRVRMFSINEAPNLHTLCCRVKISILFLPRTTFNNLRKLSIRIGYNGFDVMYLPRLNSMFPLLETLDLNDIKRLGEVKISHDRLESLSLSSKFNTITGQIDCKNLVSYKYEGKTIPSLLIKSPRLQDVQLKLLTDYPLDTWWFLRLKQYLETFKQPGVLLNLQLQIESSMVEFNPALLSEQSICPLTNFKHLRFLHIESSQNHRDIIDGMLWTIHPEMISVKLLSQPDSTFIKLLYENLMDRKEKLACCNGYQIRCWRHYLKAVELIVEETKEIPEHYQILHKVAYDFMKDYGTGEEVKFKFTW
ncbi:putative F-box/LRR-repeat protein At5g02930 [Quercus lobata]|nr:putative F-box/LRR-repeat protein At5g02930 [Quercus lobata]